MFSTIASTSSQALAPVCARTRRCPTLTLAVDQQEREARHLAHRREGNTAMKIIVMPATTNSPTLPPCHTRA